MDSARATCVTDWLFGAGLSAPHFHSCSEKEILKASSTGGREARCLPCAVSRLLSSLPAGCCPENLPSLSAFFSACRSKPFVVHQKVLLVSTSSGANTIQAGERSGWIGGETSCHCKSVTAGHLTRREQKLPTCEMRAKRSLDCSCSCSFRNRLASAPWASPVSRPVIAALTLEEHA